MSISYIFLFSPNYSGTTVISQFVTQSIKDSCLPPYGNNEGQFAGQGEGNDAKKSLGRQLQNWLEANQKRWDKLAIKNNKTIFIEESTPNMMRAPKILETFKESKIIFSISSPYSYFILHIQLWHHKKTPIRISTISQTTAFKSGRKNGPTRQGSK